MDVDVTLALVHGWKIVALLPGTSLPAPIRSLTTVAIRWAIACAPVHDGTPIATRSAANAAVLTVDSNAASAAFIIVFSFLNLPVLFHVWCCYSAAVEDQIDPHRQRVTPHRRSGRDIAILCNISGLDAADKPCHSLAGIDRVEKNAFMARQHVGCGDGALGWT